MDIGMAKALKETRKVSAAVISPLVVLSFQYFILVSFNLTGTASGARVQFMSKMLVGLIFIYAFPVVWNNNKNKLIGTYFIATLIFVFNYLVFPGNRTYMNEHIFPLFFMGLPAFVYARSVLDWRILKEVMKKASSIVLVLGLIVAALVITGRANIGVYSMAFSYYLLLPAIIFANESFNNPTLKSVFATVLSVLVILAFGARGPFLAFSGFIFLKFKPYKRLGKKEVLIYLTLGSFVFVGLLFFENIILGLQSLLEHYGITSRTLSLFMRPEVALSGRDRLYAAVAQEISQQPILGLGIAGDRLIIGNYVHNFYIEILSHFGVIIGGGILILFSAKVLKTFFTQNRNHYEMFVISFSLGFVPLMVSGSYLLSMNFWVFLGLLFQGERMFAKNRHQETNVQWLDDRDNEIE